MVRNSTSKFKVPLKENDWVQNFCVDVHNLALSKILEWISPLEVSEGFTQDISKFFSCMGDNLVLQ